MVVWAGYRRGSAAYQGDVDMSPVWPEAADRPGAGGRGLLPVQGVPQDCLRGGGAAGLEAFPGEEGYTGVEEASQGGDRSHTCVGRGEV